MEFHSITKCDRTEANTEFNLVLRFITYKILRDYIVPLRECLIFLTNLILFFYFSFSILNKIIKIFIIYLNQRFPKYSISSQGSI